MKAHTFETDKPGAKRCTVCGQEIPVNFQSAHNCPGAVVYPYGQWPAHLMTKTQLAEKALGMPLEARAAGCYLRKTMAPHIVYLYDSTQAVPRRSPSEAQ